MWVECLMARQKTLTASTFLQEVIRFGVYKPSQGRVARQITCATIWVTCALGSWRLWGALLQSKPALRWGLPGTLLLVGLWLGYRLVNLPKFTDFLIAVEAEMMKVSWPSKAELIRSSIVVIAVIFILASVLFGFDIVWQRIFTLMGIRN